MPDRLEKLDRFKLLKAIAILSERDLATIRERSLSNLDCWNAKGLWVRAHDEWRVLMASGTDEELIAAMTGLDQKSNWLRHSAPYLGLIGQEKCEALLEEVGLTPAAKKADRMEWLNESSFPANGRLAE